MEANLFCQAIWSLFIGLGIAEAHGGVYFVTYPPKIDKLFAKFHDDCIPIFGLQCPAHQYKRGLASSNNSNGIRENVEVRQHRFDTTGKLVNITIICTNVLAYLSVMKPLTVTWRTDRNIR